MLGARGERNEAAEIRELAQLPGGIAFRAQALLRPVGPRHLGRAPNGNRLTYSIPRDFIRFKRCVLCRPSILAAAVLLPRVVTRVRLMTSARAASTAAR